MGKKYNACTISGMDITNKQAIQCKRCHYYMIEEEAMKLYNRSTCCCPLCHADCTDAELVTILDE